MRITNKIMQNNSLHNINSNKLLQDKLSTQLSTQKKITRPSDDPVIAIRALRLRSDVSQIRQYYEKNSPDAESWLKITEDALGTTTEVLLSMTEQANRGANKDFGYEDLDIIVTQLKALRDEFYATGNVDFAGRYVFTGYRTDTTLTYTEDTTQDFTITEQLSVADIDTLNYTSLGDVEGLSKDNYDPAIDGGKSENTIQNADIHRIRLAYDNLKSLADGQTITISTVDDPKAVPETTTDMGITVDVVSSTANPNPYEYIQDPANAGKAVLIPETGELLLGSDLYDAEFKNMDTDKGIRISYEKNSWKDGDLRPQHYFACTDEDKGIDYNFTEYEYLDPADNTMKTGTYISSEGESQVIEYDVGYNQKIRVNTTADEVFTLDMDRAIDDLENALAELKEIDTVRTDMEKMLDGMTEGEAGYDNMKQTYAAADKAYTYIRENMQKLFEGFITKVQDISANTNVAITDNGTRSSRLDLVSNRLMTQKTTFQTLQSANEDVDITEVTVQLTSMDYTYQSALMATGKILQNSLMHYI